nr:protein WEAK CHLOROPLAST MOVEMENT UNDER BLUE LIGHT-like 1 [Aegilops tauschii subsp. strangulata]
MPQSDKGWSCAKLTDERASPVLEQMKADFKPGNARAAKVTGALLLREFLTLCVAPLQARARPLWRLGDEEDKICLSPEALPDDELSAVLRLLVGDNQEYPPSAFVPLFRHSDWEQIVASRPTFDSRELVPPAPTGAPAAPKPVELSSDESHGEEEGEEEDSGVTPEGMGETAPLSKADILRALPDDAEVDTCQKEGELPVIPTKAPGACAPIPQASRLSGFKLPKCKVDYAVVDQPLPSVKKRKEDAAAAPPSVRKGGDSTRTSPARSPSRDQGECRHEESAPEAPLAPEVPMSGSAAEIPKAQEPLVSQALVTASPPSPAAPLFPGSSASSAVLERALSEMTQPREDLLGADPRLVAGRLELASSWLQSDAAVRATLSQAVTASEKEKRSAAQAAVDREAALKDAEAAHDRCRALEDELKGLRDEHAEEARGRRAKEEEMRAREDAIKNRDAELGELAKSQAAEHGRLEELERKVEVAKVDLDAKAKILPEDHTAFMLLEKRSRVALKSLYEKGLERSGFQGKWVASSVTEKDVKELREAGYLAVDVAHRLPAKKQVIPTPEPGERVVFIPHFLRGLGFPLHLFVRAATAQAAEVSKLPWKLKLADDDIVRINKRFDEAQGSAAEVETLKSTLAQAKEQARVSKVAADKAAVDLKAEQVTRRQYEERVTEVEQELKDAAGKCEALEEKNKAQAVDLAKALQEAKEARTESRAAREEIKQAQQIVAGKPFLLQSKFGSQKYALLTRLWSSPDAFADLPKNAADAAQFSEPKRGTRRRSSSGHSTWRQSVQHCRTTR